MKEKKQSLKSKVTYVKKNWMLYIFFLMPALLLTIIFKYVPMGGLLIAFKDYNVIKGARCKRRRMNPHKHSRVRAVRWARC